MGDSLSLAHLGLVWSPCSGPLPAVAYASRSSLGRVRGWIVARIGRVKKLSGLLLGLAGLAILSGGDKWLEAQLLQLPPEAWLRLTLLF